MVQVLRLKFQGKGKTISGMLLLFLKRVFFYSKIILNTPKNNIIIKYIVILIEMTFVMFVILTLVDFKLFYRRYR